MTRECIDGHRLLQNIGRHRGASASVEIVKVEQGDAMELGKRFLLCSAVLRAGVVFGLSLAVAVCLAMFAAPAQGQALSGIQGTVTDESGASVPDAAVTVTNNGTGVVTRTTTSSVGSFTVTDLIPGTYTVKIEKQGF